MKKLIFILMAIVGLGCSNVSDCTNLKINGVNMLTAPPGAINPDDLSRAIYNGDVDGIQNLLFGGVSPNRTVRYEIIFEGYHHHQIELSPIAEVIFNYSGNPSNPDFVRNEQKGCLLIELLIKHGANPNMRLTAGATPLHMTCGQFCEGIMSSKMFATLVEKGADRGARNADGDTPIDLIRFFEH